jgi:hypothetical protein
VNDIAAGRQSAVSDVAGNLSPAEARRLTRRVLWRLTRLPADVDAVVELLHLAIDRRAHEALGYPSVPPYAADRFDFDGVERSIATLSELADALRGES